MKPLKVGKLGKNGEVIEWTPEEITRRVFRRETRCKKGNHTGVTNDFGVTWCQDCGLLMKTVSL